MTDLTLRYPPAVDNARPDRPNSIAGYAGMIVAAFVAARNCRNDRQIDRLIQQNGGVMSDEVERRINRHLGA